MEYKWFSLLTIFAFIFVAVNCASTSSPYKRGDPRNCPGCHQPPPRNGASVYSTSCCTGRVRKYFQTDQFENIFSKRNSLESHAVGFWDYQSFITASAQYQPYGFGTTYMNNKFFGKIEVAAFLAHVGTKTSCEFSFCFLNASNVLCYWFGWISIWV